MFVSQSEFSAEFKRDLKQSNSVRVKKKKMSQSKLGKYKEKESRDCDLIPDKVGFRGKSIKRKK